MATGNNGGVGDGRQQWRLAKGFEFEVKEVNGEGESEERGYAARLDFRGL